MSGSFWNFDMLTFVWGLLTIASIGLAMFSLLQIFVLIPRRPIQRRDMQFVSAKEWAGILIIALILGFYVFPSLYIERLENRFFQHQIAFQIPLYKKGNGNHLLSDGKHPNGSIYKMKNGTNIYQGKIVTDSEKLKIISRSLDAQFSAKSSLDPKSVAPHGYIRIKMHSMYLIDITVRNSWQCKFEGERLEDVVYYFSTVKRWYDTSTDCVPWDITVRIKNQNGRVLATATDQPRETCYHPIIKMDCRIYTEPLAGTGKIDP